MDKQVTIQTVASRTPDGGGGYTEIPGELATVWASVEPLEGREQLIAMQTGIQRPHRFTMRYRSDLSPTAGLTYAGRRFDVKSVVDTEERHVELVILADEIT